MARGDGFDFTPILTHYVFLVTFVLAIVSDIFIFRCAVVAPPVELTQFSHIKQAGWMTAFIGQVAFEAASTASTFLLVVEPARPGLSSSADPPIAGTLWFGILYAHTNVDTFTSLADDVTLRF